MIKPAEFIHPEDAAALRQLESILQFPALILFTNSPYVVTDKRIMSKKECPMSLIGKYEKDYR